MWPYLFKHLFNENEINGYFQANYDFHFMPFLEGIKAKCYLIPGLVQEN